MVSALALPSSPVSASNVVQVDEGQSIQAAVDAAEPGTTIMVSGNHAEQVVIMTDGIKLVAKGATLSMPDEPDFEGPCGPTLLCVTSPAGDFEDPFNPDNKIHDVAISGFTLSNPYYDSIGTYFTDNATIERNTVTGSDCSGIWMLFADNFRIERNTVDASVNCGNIDLAASDTGVISRNTTTNGGFAGINTDDVSNVVIDRNTSTGNCIGIVAADSPNPASSSNVTITRNTANGNNTVCYPFGPPEVGGPPVGVAGILVVGPTDVVVSRNTANDNVSTDPAGTITAGGIVIGDFFDNISMDVLVDRNTATGNSTIAGPLDINIGSIGSPITLTRNHCGYSEPNPDWCSN